MDALREAQAKRAKAHADVSALLYEVDGQTKRTLADEDRSAVAGHLADIQVLNDEVALLEADDAMFKQHAVDRSLVTQSAVRQTIAATPEIQTAESTRLVPPTARRYSRLRSFKGPNAELNAYRFGVWFASMAGYPWAVARAQDQGLTHTRAANEGTNTAGGFLVPDEFSSTLIDIREQYGTFRQFARIEPMTSEIKRLHRRTGGLTVYFVGESEAGTESQKTWDDVVLTARKAMVLTKYTAEVNEDAIINMADDLANEIGYAFAKKEDDCGFLGDGSQSTYGGIVGLGPSFTNLNGVDEGGGIIVGTGDTPAELTLSDFNKTVAILSAPGDVQDPAWYCNRNVWAHMQRLESAAGGTPGSELVEGFRVKTFLGYPVRFAQSMQTGTAVSQPLAYLGDLAMAAAMGTNRDTTLAVSTDALNAFEQDELAIRGTERFDIVVHDIGTATVAGPLVLLLGKAS